MSTEIAARCMGLSVPQSPFLNETRIRRIEAARYEGQEIAGALHVVREGDRVLELGAGLGIVGGVTALNAKPEALLSFEANPAMIPHIEALYACNDLADRAKVRNAVLLSTPDQPDSVTFHVHNSFLGSSLVDTPARKTTPVDVSVEDFETVRRDFAPTVMLVDIEGGEKELLDNADLDGIRAIVIEFHPGVYGIDGMRACKARLKAAGFEKVPEHSTRTVWTCTRTLH
ncbi:FkbM family methyltransferase [Thalassococcus sp. CAU 1522]|uniref:FkbM family methyltransferase n=1 Tax=Thalassococcus arenae TaxID=2851652 RepID=A0ABS6N8L0_9RHOB|nr:FkbM family methyltransferase [Thalassococcus arenae]MBV2360352.1 FkbM family methyltransferase [Thalassococcus arenae]